MRTYEFLPNPAYEVSSHKQEKKELIVFVLHAYAQTRYTPSVKSYDSKINRILSRKQ